MTYNNLVNLVKGKTPNKTQQKINLLTVAYNPNKLLRIRRKTLDGKMINLETLVDNIPFSLLENMTDIIAEVNKLHLKNGSMVSLVIY